MLWSSHDVDSYKIMEKKGGEDHQTYMQVKKEIREGLVFFKLFLFFPLILFIFASIILRCILALVLIVLDHGVSFFILFLFLFYCYVSQSFLCFLLLLLLLLLLWLLFIPIILTQAFRWGYDYICRLMISFVSWKGVLQVHKMVKYW